MRAFLQACRRGAGVRRALSILLVTLAFPPAEAQNVSLETFAGLVSPFAVRGWGAHGTLGMGNYALDQIVTTPSIVGSSFLWVGSGAQFSLSVSLVPATSSDIAAFQQVTNVPASEVVGMGPGMADVLLRAQGPAAVDQFRLSAQVVGIACGEFHTVLLRRDGTVAAAGWDRVGQANVPASATNVVAVACGLDHSLAVRSDGTAIAWGHPVGDPLVPAAADNRGIVAAAGGARHSVFLRRDGRVLVAGDRMNSEMAPPRFLANVVAVSAGAFHCLALTADHRTVEWGRWLDDDSAGAAVDHDNWPRIRPAADVVAISAGGYFNLALHANGTVTAWGEGEYGETEVPESATNVVAISAGTYHALALRGDGTVVAWGVAENGVTLVPPGLTNVVAISAGGYHNQVLVQVQPVLTWPRVESGRFRAELNLPAGMRYRLETAGESGLWTSRPPATALPGSMVIDLPADTARAVLVRVRPLFP